MNWLKKLGWKKYGIVALMLVLMYGLFWPRDNPLHLKMWFSDTLARLELLQLTPLGSSHDQVKRFLTVQLGSASDRIYETNDRDDMLLKSRPFDSLGASFILVKIVEYHSLFGSCNMTAVWSFDTNLHLIAVDCQTREAGL